MFRINKKVCAFALGLMLLFVFAVPADAQSFRRYRDRGMSTGEKAGYIGGGAAAGAVVGGLLKGKTGAIVGGLLGAGAGTAYVLIKENRDEDRYRGRYRSRSSRYRGRF